jgi:streptomycin 6-kinase
MFQAYLTRWNLTPDGKPITTPTSRLLPVIYQNAPAMLKIALVTEEKGGGELMAWWEGDGAARVFAQSEDAVLLERAAGSKSLAKMARNGGDDDACRILCAVVAKLHAPRDHPAPAAVRLTVWFQELAPAAKTHGGILTLCAETAQSLLSTPQDKVILHGDIHHGNVLDFGERGWLAIDPKGLWGERGFDYANLFCNPNAATATAPGRVARRADVVAAAASLDRRRLLMWVLAGAGLSAVWMISDGKVPDHALEIASQAAIELGLTV